MRIVHVAPYCELVPPPRDGGTERAIYELTEGLVSKGHEVILFAPPGSSSSGRLISYPEQPIGDEDIARFVAAMLPEGVDLIHDHTFSSAVGKLNLPIPTVCTMHLPHNNGVRHPVYVSRRALEHIGSNIGHFIYNGLRYEQYQYSEQKDDYLLFMGRIIREKGILIALDVAETTNRTLIIAGPKHDPELFRSEIEPRLKRNPKLVYVGSVGGQQKQDLLKRAGCVLFPSIWEEPFGLVMIEAMACGTPVLAMNTGAVSEVMAGFPNLVCSSVEEMVEKVRSGVQHISPRALRQYVESHFSTDVMTERYLDYYIKVIRETPQQAAAAPAGASAEPVPPGVRRAGPKRRKARNLPHLRQKSVAVQRKGRRRRIKAAPIKAKTSRPKRKKRFAVRRLKKARKSA